MKIFKNENNVTLREYDLRRDLLIEESEDITRNANDYVRGGLDLATQTSYLDIAKNGNIEKVVSLLNESWNYNIKTINISDELIFYLGMQISKTLGLEDKYLLIDLYYEEICNNLAPLYLEKGYGNKYCGLLTSVDEFIDDYKMYIVGRLYENKIVEKQSNKEYKTNEYEEKICLEIKEFRESE